jgi:UDP-glucose 4-epimerase
LPAIVSTSAAASLCGCRKRVFHLAALADIVPSIQHPDDYYDTNVTGTFNVLQAAREAGARRLVYAASSSCYGIPDNYPTPETAEIRPEYPYALTKYLGEQLVLHWGGVYDLSVASLRFFNVYGPRSRTSGTYGAVFGVFLAQLLAEKPLTIVGDGEQTRDFTYVGDVADAVATVGGIDIGGEVFNVGTGQDVSVNRLVELLGAKETVHIPKRPGEPDCTLADVGRVRERFGWRARVPIEEGVRIMLDNIDYWRDAPVWSADRIADATKDWFRYLSDD